MTATGLVRAALGLALIVAAGIIAPGDAPGNWSWVGILLAAMAAGTAIMLLDRFGIEGTEENERHLSMVIAAVLLLAAVAISALFSVLTLLFSIVILILVVFHLAARGPSSPIVFWTLVGTLVPFWVWSAFEAWDRWLLMLIPLGIVGMVALEHALRSDLVKDSQREGFAAWIGVTIVAATFLMTGMGIDAEIRWVAMGAGAVAILAAVDILPLRNSFRDTIPGFVLPGIGLMTLALAWLIAL